MMVIVQVAMGLLYRSEACSSPRVNLRCPTPDSPKIFVPKQKSTCGRNYTFPDSAHADAPPPVCSGGDFWFMAGAISGFYSQPKCWARLDSQLSRRRKASWFTVNLLSSANGETVAYSERSSRSELALAEGPSCIFVGPIETASKETLEALYRQARDAYYSGKPLIVDDMFDKVELKLRWYGSKSVVKYPRCSLRRQSTYADAEEDPSQVFALASVWIVLLTFSSLAFLVPVIYTANLAYQDEFDGNPLSNDTASRFQYLATLNGILSMVFGSVICYPIALASVRALQRLWRNDLVALKGACPNCGEEVFAFVAADQSNQTPHRSDCHVCESALEFRPKVESISGASKRWVYGRIYLLRQRRRYKSQRWM